MCGLLWSTLAAYPTSGLQHGRALPRSVSDEGDIRAAREMSAVVALLVSYRRRCHHNVARVSYRCSR